MVMYAAFDAQRPQTGRGTLHILATIAEFFLFSRLAIDLLTLEFERRTQKTEWSSNEPCINENLNSKHFNSKLQPFWPLSFTKSFTVV